MCLVGYVVSEIDPHHTSLNKRLVTSMEKLNTDVEGLHDWRSRIMGAKTSLVAVGLLITHTVVVLGSMVALVSWTNNR